MEKSITMASLFDGIGGFPLAAVRCGVEPVWASEIEPFPILVTKLRFPKMTHMGDITKLNGADLPPVDNMVIQETLQWMAERQQYAETTVRKPAAPETPERAVPTENTSTAFPEPENPGAPPAPENAGASVDASRPDSTDLPLSEGERPVYAPPQSDVQSRAAGSTYYGPTVGEAVVRMLHHMSRIFEDNSRTDRIHRGLQIDRKRRQELQRKRLAMGHKADDHEEISLK